MSEYFGLESFDKGDENSGRGSIEALQRSIEEREHELSITNPIQFEIAMRLFPKLAIGSLSSGDSLCFGKSLIAISNWIGLVMESSCSLSSMLLWSASIEPLPEFSSPLSKLSNPKYSLI